MMNIASIQDHQPANKRTKAKNAAAAVSEIPTTISTRAITRVVRYLEAESFGTFRGTRWYVY